MLSSIPVGATNEGRGPTARRGKAAKHVSCLSGITGRKLSTKGPPMLLKITLAAICVAFAVPLAVRADAVPDAAQKAITADYQLACTAFPDPTDANLAAFVALLAPEFVQIDFKGKQTQRDAYVAQQKQMVKQLHITTCNNTIESSTLPDPATIVVVVSAKFAGQIQAPDGNHDIDGTASSQDTWKLENSTWLQTQSKDVSTLVKIDGKVVQDEGN